METILNDLWLNLEGYYDTIINFLPKAVVAAVAFSVLFFIANRGQRVITNRLSRRMDDPLLASFLGRVLKIVIVLIAIMLVLNILGLKDIATGLFAGASFSAVVIGFAFKDIGENFLAGIILAFNRPFGVGDTVELDGIKGQVIELSMRTSHIKTFDGKDVFIPNASVVKNPVFNYTIDGFLRNEFVVGLDYGSDVDEAIDLIISTLDKIDGILTEHKKPNVFISDLNTSTLDVTVQYWLNTFDKSYTGSSIKTTAVNNVLTALNNAGYYLPGNILELKNYNQDEIKMGNQGKSSSTAV